MHVVWRDLPRKKGVGPESVESHPRLSRRALCFATTCVVLRIAFSLLTQEPKAGLGAWAKSGGYVREEVSGEDVGVLPHSVAGVSASSPGALLRFLCKLPERPDSLFQEDAVKTARYSTSRHPQAHLSIQACR